MSLKLYFHPLASFCHKVLIALYENETAFQGELVDLSDARSRAAFLEVWPVGKFPVLRDESRGLTLPESTIIIEYLAEHYPGKVALVPEEPDLALQVRLRDRFYDWYVDAPMAKIVTDRLRPTGSNDRFGVAQAREGLLTAYAIVEEEMQSNTWAVGSQFTMADCAAAPALFFANKVLPFGHTHPNLARYLERLMNRPSFARVLREAEPYLPSMPQAEA
jgi:glutathione S-transferase